MGLVDRQPDVVLRKMCGRRAGSQCFPTRPSGADSRSHHHRRRDAAWTLSTRRNIALATRGANRSRCRRQTADDCRFGRTKRRPATARAHRRWRDSFPVGGTMCAESPARNRLPYCIGSATKVRMQAQLVPDPLIGPEAELLIRRALQIEPRDRRRANAEERESALVVRVDQFFGRGRRFGQDSQPGERINANHHSR